MSDRISTHKLLIIGASGHGKVAADIALKMGKWKEIAFLDDDESLKASMGMKVIGPTLLAYELKEEYDVFVAIGSNQVRESFSERLEAGGAFMPTLIHPSVIIGEKVEIGTGTVIMAGAIINCCSKIGKGCIINTGATLDHDNYIEEFVHISPGVHLAGTVRVGKGSWLGISSVVINNVSITSGCIIGAGAVVVKNLTKAGTYVGVPARRIFHE